MIADSAVEKDCINIYSYGVVCVRCGCCSKNPDFRNRTICEIHYYKSRLAECMKFEPWCDNPRMKQILIRNNQANIRDYKRAIRTCKRILRTTMNGGV